MSRHVTSRIDRTKSNWRRLWGEPIGWVWISAFVLHLVALLWVQGLVFFGEDSSDEHGIFVVSSMRFAGEEKRDLPSTRPREVEIPTEAIPTPTKNNSNLDKSEKKVVEQGSQEIPQWNPLTKLGTKTELRDSKSDGVTIASETGVKVFGLQSPVKKVVFLIDVSGTMWNEINGRWGFQVAQDEVVRCVSAMPLEMMFNVVYYSDTTTSYSQGLVSATPENKEGARRFLSIRPNMSGATDFFKGIEGAYDQKPDAVFIFTDGEMDLPQWKIPSRFDAIKEKMGYPIPLFGVGFFYEKNRDSLDLLQRLCFISGGDFKLYNRYTPSMKPLKKP